MQYIPCNSALLAQEALFLPKKALFMAKDLQKKGLPAYSHHDRFPPWWVFVRDDNGGNLSGDKIPPLMMIIINHLTQFNLSHW